VKSTPLVAFVVYFREQLLYCLAVVAKADSLTSSRRAMLPARGQHRGRRIAQLVVVCFAVIVMVDAVVGERGLLAMRRATRQYDELSAALERQRAENARLREQARRLQEDPSAIEELARRELGLIRPGEKVFIVRDLKSPTTP
jgi:cell division protein FtsB